jgi:hypothetical protein
VLAPQHVPKSRPVRIPAITRQAAVTKRIGAPTRLGAERA